MTDCTLGANAFNLFGPGQHGADSTEIVTGGVATTDTWLGYYWISTGLQIKMRLSLTEKIELWKGAGHLAPKAYPRILYSF